MQLIKELLSLNEIDDDNKAKDGTEAAVLQAMEDGPEKNLKAVDLLLRSDGDIPIGDGRRSESRNQMDRIGEEDGSQVFYVAIDPPHGTVEAYVVVDKEGDFSYFDFTDEVVVVNGKFHSGGGDTPSRDWQDKLEDIIQEYQFESGKVKEGGIKAYLAHLMAAD